jgi:sugar (glycoside-pentoside-hexuronide) transporter
MADASIAAQQSPPLRAGAKIAYGIGDFGFGLTWNMVGAFLLYFYTDVALLPAAAVGTLFLLSRLLDAAFDPVVGVLVDRTRSRWGRARPYFLWGAVPFGILCVATFWVPPLGMEGRLLWGVGTFVLLGLMFSVVNIPYGALLPMMTSRPEERIQLSSLRAAGTALSVIVVTAATMPLVQLLGGGDEAHGFLLTAALFGALTTLVILNLFVRCPEQVHAASADTRTDLLPSILAMLRNRAWLVVFLFTTLNFIRFGAVLSVTPYFAINVLKQPWMISVLLPAVSGTLLLGSILAPPFLRRLGMRNGNRIALLATLLLYAPLPFLEASPPAFLTLYVAGSISLSITMAAIFAMVAEATDYHEALYGVRHEGLLSSGISLSTKIGMALGSALIAFGLAAAAYDPQAVSGAAAAAIRWLYYAPMLAIVLLQLICIGFYPSATARRDGGSLAVA